MSVINRKITKDNKHPIRSNVGKSTRQAIENKLKTLKQDANLDFNSILDGMESQSTKIHQNQFLNEESLQPILQTENRIQNKKPQKVKKLQTEPNNHRINKKDYLFLPSIRKKQASANLFSHSQSLKLKQLYEKKNILYKKMQFLNKQIKRAEIDGIKQDADNKINPQLNQKNEPKISQSIVDLDPSASKLPGQTNRFQSKSYTNSRNHHYSKGIKYLEFNRRKDNSPQSIISVEKNREVISFIKKMHQQSIKRDLKRIQRNNKSIEGHLNHVCMDCSRSKCQVDIFTGILAQSRAI